MLARIPIILTSRIRSFTNSSSLNRAAGLVSIISYQTFFAMTSRLFSTLLLCLTSLLTITAQEQAFRFEKDGQMLNMTERMAIDQTKAVAMTVLYQGNLILQEQWGFRDAEAELPATDETIFQVGSLSHAVVKFAILQLVSQGVLDLDTDVNTYLHQWQLPSTSVTRSTPVTLRDLMTHRRGFKFPYKPGGFKAGAPLPSHLDLLNGTGYARNPRVILKKDINKSGNHTFAGALIMQQILEEHYQLPLPELMQAHIFQPLGMQNTFYAVELDDAQKEKLAVGYDRQKQRLDGDYRRYPELAASGMYSTSTDFARFVQYTFDALAGRDNSLLSVEVAKVAMLSDGANDNPLLFNLSETDYFWGGASVGYYTQFAAAKDGEWVIVAFMNDDLNWSFNRELRSQGKLLVEEQKRMSQGRE